MSGSGSSAVSEADKIGEIAAEIYTDIAAARAQLAACERKVKMLERRAKQASRMKRKQRSLPSERRPTGFARPTDVSSALKTFMGLPEEHLVARTEATRAINAYIKENGLQDPANAQHILPDAKLRQLLGLSESEPTVLTYFNLQHHMNPHFKKGGTDAVETDASA